MFPLQYFLYEQINNIQAYRKILSSAASGAVAAAFNLPTQSLKMALTVVATGPIVFAYPFVQKYFVQGITIGAVKRMMKSRSATLRTVSCKNWLILQEVGKKYLGFMRIDEKMK